jgi:hypothetical protein
MYRKVLNWKYRFCIINPYLQKNFLNKLSFLIPPPPLNPGLEGARDSGLR